MALFPNLELEALVRENDKTRLSAVKTFASKDEATITLIEIDPDGSGYIDVTGTSQDDWYLDHEFSTSGTITVSVRVTSDGAPVIKTKDIEVLLEADDIILSSDYDLVGHESDILNYVRNGRNTFLDKHRVARDRMLSWLDEQKIWGNDNQKLTVSEIVNKDEFKEWSKFETLIIIFESISNSVDDIFDVKAKKYMSLRDAARNRGALRLDRNRDGDNDSVNYSNTSGTLVRV